MSEYPVGEREQRSLRKSLVAPTLERSASRAIGAHAKRDLVPPLTTQHMLEAARQQLGTAARAHARA
jgi:hypothetical protein